MALALATQKENRVFLKDPGSDPGGDPDRSAHGMAAGWPALVGFVGLSLLLAAADAAAVPPIAASWWLSLAQPPGLLPAKLFAPAWALLSLPGGLAAWLAWREPGHRRALLLWGWHLLAFAAWMQCLLVLRAPPAALGAALALVLLSAATAAQFARLRPLAGLLLLPTTAFACYAAAASAALWWLNRG